MGGGERTRQRGIRCGTSEGYSNWHMSQYPARSQRGTHHLNASYGACPYLEGNCGVCIRRCASFRYDAQRCEVVCMQYDRGGRVQQGVRGRSRRNRAMPISCSMMRCAVNAHREHRCAETGLSTTTSRIAPASQDGMSDGQEGTDGVSDEEGEETLGPGCVAGGSGRT